MAALNLRTYLRKIPPDLLKRHLAFREVALPDDIPPEDSTRQFQDAVAASLQNSMARSATRFIADAERIDQAADEAFEQVLENLEDHPAPSDQTSRHGRLTVALLDAPTAFRRAELARHTDTKRRKRMWDGFQAPPHLPLGRDQETVARLKGALRAFLRSPHVEVDIFERRKPTVDGSEITLVHMTVFREGRPVEGLRFDASGELAPHADWPVFEAALTYEPATGALEIVAGEIDSRGDFARLCADHLLGIQPGEKLALRQFNLNRLKRPFEFDTDPEDAIEGVDVTLLRLMPVDTEAERVILQCLRAAEGTIWTMAQNRFAEHDPLNDNWLVTQAKLTVRFRNDRAQATKNTLTFTLTAPHGCDLKDGTERERLIGEKYLRRWGILTNG